MSIRFLTFSLAVVLACSSACTTQEEGQQEPMADSGITTLQKNDVKPGTGAEARKGQEVSVHYTGWLYNPAAPDHKGQQFDSSRESNQPYEFLLGGGVVIPGWDEGIAGMRVGGIRILTIPPAMAYGSQSVGGVIPPNATLLFEVELVSVK